MEKVKIVVDSDAIFARYNPHDPLYAKATATFQQLIGKGYQLVYPTSVIFEVVSLFQRVLSEPTVTSLLIELIKSGQLSVITVDENILKQSALLFNPTGIKKNTLVDCSVVAIARKIKAEGVFSYDSFYKKQGLKLAEEILKE
jgi:predicted nucleic acid-binding protein